MIKSRMGHFDLLLPQTQGHVENVKTAHRPFEQFSNLLSFVFQYFRLNLVISKELSNDPEIICRLAFHETLS